MTLIQKTILLICNSSCFVERIGKLFNKTFSFTQVIIISNNLDIIITCVKLNVLLNNSFLLQIISKESSRDRLISKRFRNINSYLQGKYSLQEKDQFIANKLKFCAPLIFICLNLHFVRMSRHRIPIYHAAPQTTYYTTNIYFLIISHFQPHPPA